MCDASARPAQPLAPAVFRDRIRPYLPGTVLELIRLWPHARKHGYDRGDRFLVGPYCPGCGPGIVWLFRPGGEPECTADPQWLNQHFKVVLLSKSRCLYTFQKRWDASTSGGTA